MELKYLNTVRMILETGSFQEAARRLHYTQSTVTFQVQQLEKELNVKLFEKLGRRMALTQAGRDVLPYMDGVLDAAAALLDYGKRETELKGTLTVGFLESLLIYKTPRILREFREKAPDVQLSLKIANCYEIVAAIASGAVDVGLHYNVTKQSLSVVTEPLAQQPSALVASPELAEDERDFISPGQMKDAAIIYSEEQSVHSRILNEYMLRKNIKMKHSMQVQSIEAIKLCVAGNLGVAFLPRCAVEDELRDGRLIELDTEIEGGTVRAMLSYHKNKWMSPAMRLFIELVKESFLTEPQ